MKTALLLILLFFANASFSQIYLGQSKSEILRRARADELSTRVEADEKGVSVETRITSKYYRVNENLKCIAYVMVPKSNAALHYFVEQFNKEYVIVDSRNWKMYSEGEIVNVELFWDAKNRQDAFIWSYAE